MERNFIAANLSVSITQCPQIPVLKKTNLTAFQLQQICLANLKCATFPSKKVQEWCNLVMLQIHECSNLKEVNFYSLNCLCHLELIRLENLQSFHFTEIKLNSSKRPNGTLKSLHHIVLKHLTSLKCLLNFNLYTLLKSFQNYDQL